MPSAIFQTVQTVQCKGLHEHFIRTCIDDIAQGQCLPCDLCDFFSLPPCQNKPLHHSAKDLNHLSSDASSCYLDNCQQEQAFPFSVTACSGTIMFLINNFTHLVAARGCQDANNIYRLLCELFRGGWVFLIALTEADSTQNLRSLQIDSAKCRLLEAAGCACRHEPGDGAQHGSCVSAWSQTKNIFFSSSLNTLADRVLLFI